MPLFRRVEWPRDHRDEVVAGALVGAVVIVLGYASGIGAPSGTAEAAVPPTSPPAATAPASPVAPGGSGAQDTGTGSGGGFGTGELPSHGSVGGVGPGTGYGTGGQGGYTGGGTGDSGHSGHETSPPPGSTTPTPTPTLSPTVPDAGTCQDGEVTLVRPLLDGLSEPLFGILNGSGSIDTGTGTGTGTEETPEPQPSPCVGLAPVSVTGLLGISASPLPEATP
ncbi:hypothetical protein [Streptomyces sp. AC555_RSS877]|uniref:hypothetical protein n=1 Tax=Streptomyces sp. AC555_RSS877 TaxID=2823688 RepID=UPI001C269C65|nr:hypothetical protein [Streptomyces sp. AC555_RSS877]